MHPQLGGIGPGQTFRQQAFKTLQDTAKNILRDIQAHPHPTKDQVETMMNQIHNMQKGIDLYCKGVTSLGTFNQSYITAKTTVDKLFQACKIKVTDQKQFLAMLDTAVSKIKQQMMFLVHMNYVDAPKK